MDSLYILIPVGVILIGIAVALFLWAVNNHQFDDLDSEGQRLLFSRDDTESDAPASAGSISDSESATAGAGRPDPETKPRTPDR